MYNEEEKNFEKAVISQTLSDISDAEY